jgi:hypothetical protein
LRTLRAWPLRAAVLFVSLFTAALLATAVVVGSRSPELVLEVKRLPARISPNGDGIRDTAEITFFVRESDPHAEVSIVGRDLEPIRTLASDVSLNEDERVSYVWDGRSDLGVRAPPGRYRLRVVLPDRERDMVFPRRIALEQG